jgi:hypothetical protein
MQGNETPPRGDYFLEVLDEVDRAVREIPLAGHVTVGRGGPDFKPVVSIPGECQSASRQHADIDLRGERPVLTDHSRFGTIVKGRLLQNTSLPLHHGDDIVFGLAETGWHVRFRVTAAPGTETSPADPLELLVVSEAPRQVRIGRLVVEEQLGHQAFRLLKFLAENKGRWYPVHYLVDYLWPDPDDSPLQANQALARAKRDINVLLGPYLGGQEAIQSWVHRGYRMKPSLDKE